MTKEVTLGLVRHTLTGLAGVFIAKGWVDAEISNEVIGGVILLIGAVWSIVDKAKRAKVEVAK